MPTIVFDAELISAGAGGGVYVCFPHSTLEIFGTKSQVRVKCTIDGEPYRGSLAPMGGAGHMLGVLKQIRKTIDKEVGDTVHIILEEDTAERIVDIPAELEAAFVEIPAAGVAFGKKSYTFRKEHALYISSAIKPETRARRLDKVINLLLGEINK